MKVLESSLEYLACLGLSVSGPDDRKSGRATSGTWEGKGGVRPSQLSQLLPESLEQELGMEDLQRSAACKSAAQTVLYTPKGIR